MTWGRGFFDKVRWFGGLTKEMKQLPTFLRILDMGYQYNATTLTGFIQYLASNILPYGYFNYVQGRVPAGKDPLAIDAKLLEKYQIQRSASERWRKKKAGIGNLRYLRFNRDFILLATDGDSRFLEEEGDSIRDVRRLAIKVEGYSIRVMMGGYLRKKDEDSPRIRDKKYRVRVSIGRERYLDLKAYFLEVAVHLSVEELTHSFQAIPFEPYARVRYQLWNLLRWVNKARKAAGLDVVPSSAVRTRRRQVKPFGDDKEETSLAA